MQGGHVLVITGTEENIGSCVLTALARRRAAVTQVASLSEAALALRTQSYHLVILRVGAGIRADAAAAFALEVRSRHSADLLLLALLPDAMFDTNRLIQAGFDDATTEPRHPDQFGARLSTLFRLGTMKRELARRLDTARCFNDGEELASEGLDFGTRLDRPQNASVASARVLGCSFGMDELGMRTVRHVIDTVARLDWVDDAATAQTELFRNNYDVCVLTVGSDAEAAFQFTRAMRRSSSLFNMPVLLVTADASRIDLDAAFKSGVGDVIALPTLLGDLSAHLASVHRLERLRRHLVDAYRQPAATAIQDTTTGLYGRGFAMEHLDAVIAASAEGHMPLSAGLLRVTSLPEVNRAYGYHAGDCLLRQAGEVVRRCLRGEDLGARIGGATILVLFPDTPLASARVAMGRLSSILRHTAFKLPRGAGAVSPVTTHSVIAWHGERSAEELLDTLRAEVARAAA